MPDRESHHQKKNQSLGGKATLKRKSSGGSKSKTANHKGKPGSHPKARSSTSPQKQARGGPAMPGLALRHVALDLAIAVMNEKQPLDDCLQHIFRADSPGGKLDHRDRAYVRKLVATLLRYRGSIDSVISKFVQTDLPEKGSAKMILRLGVCQILYMRTPAHAAVDLTLHLADQRKAGGLKGLMNAVLRKISKNKESLITELDQQKLLNTPDWLLARWQKIYGPEVTSAIVSQHVADPPIDLTVKADPEKWAEKFKGQLLASGTVRCQPQGPLTEWEGYEQGDWWAQDVSAAIPATLFGNLSGLTVYDLCAAPGGKTAQLCQQGAQVTAIDKSAARLSILHQNLTRLNLEADVVHADILTWRPAKKADAILLDAPCSATGTARRHPDMPWHKKESDIKTLASLQFKLLTRCLSMIKPGGLIIYCTCSLEPEEGEEQIDHFLKEFRGQIKRVPIRAQEIDLPDGAILPSGDLRLLPHFGNDQGGMDGFFISRLSYGA